MKGAIAEFNEGKLSLRLIARAWNVPRATLHKRVKVLVLGHKHSPKNKPLLSVAREQELVDLLIKLSRRGFPLSPRTVRQLAFDYAAENGIRGFSEQKKTAGWYWVQGFLQRHNQLSLRRPEALSTARAMGMNRPLVQKWFGGYEDLLDELGIRHVPSHIWNCDESGVQDHFLSKTVISETGKPSYQVTSNDRGHTSTILVGFNAAGDYTPKLVIHKGKRIQESWRQEIPKDTTLAVSDNGRITSELFFRWEEQFVAHLSKPSDGDAISQLPHLLLMDGHSAHTYNLSFLRLMEEHKVEVYIFPSHCSHWLQPADKTLFASVKRAWNAEGVKKMHSVAGRTLQKSEFLSLYNATKQKAATRANAVAGFLHTGLYPVCRQVSFSALFLFYKQNIKWQVIRH